MQYNNDIRNLFRQRFIKEVPINIRIFSRYQRGLLLYHSLAYSTKHSFTSYRVAVVNDGCSFAGCFSDFLFFFEFKKQKIFLFSLNKVYA